MVSCFPASTQATHLPPFTPRHPSSPKKYPTHCLQIKPHRPRLLFHTSWAFADRLKPQDGTRGSSLRGKSISRRLRHWRAASLGPLGIRGSSVDYVCALWRVDVSRRAGKNKVAEKKDASWSDQEGREDPGESGGVVVSVKHELTRLSLQRSVRRRAHYLDKGFSLCGFRFGWTAILGLIP
jgi:hypothetical protein